MPRNGSGTYALPVGNPVVTGTTISSTWANNTLTDIANALTASLTADGQTTASGNLNMGTNRVINAGDPQNPQDLATKYYVDELVGTLGTMAYQNANNVNITGGSVSNVQLDLHSQTGEMYLPVGPTSLRTNTPIAGLMRFNTDGGGFYEGYNGTSWQKFTTTNEGSYVITYLVVDGGGGGNNVLGPGGGGGAGGYSTATYTAIPSTNLIITVGAGGAIATNGTASSIAGVVTGVGGGHGGTASYSGAGSGTAGGSGGGGAGGTGGTGLPGGAGGVGTSGIGNNGGAGGADNGSSGGCGGGGGGAGAPGGAGGSGTGGGGGGDGRSTTITGTLTYFAGGGGGGAGNAIPYYGFGGQGGGGNGGNNTSGVAATPGGLNTGGGGGGGGFGNLGANGGSGVVILSMPTGSYSGITTGGPTVSVSGGNTILKFTSSGSYTA